MHGLSDQQLLRDYTGRRSEPAFAELVARHVHLVYSAALRMVCNEHLAEDVTQSVFVALAQNAKHLTHRAVLAGWLHRTTRNVAANTVRSDVRRRVREQEAVAMTEMVSEDNAAVWEQLAPELDAALGELGEADRDALLLRYFEGKSAREMAQALGTSDEAAQKRVSRALQRLREAFARRGVAVGAGAVLAAVSAYAVQAAPAGLAATISTAAALAGNALHASTLIAGTKLIAMTTLQKALLAATLTLAVGLGIHEARQASGLRSRVQSLQQQQAAQAGNLEQLNRQRDEAAGRQAALQEENEQLRQGTAELLKLRGEVARLRTLVLQSGGLGTASQTADNPFAQSVLALAAKAAELNQHLEQMPDKNIPEVRFLSPDDWLSVARSARFETDVDIRKALSELRSLAKRKMPMGRALDSFAQANGGQLPTALSQLKPFFATPLDGSGANWNGVDPERDNTLLETVLARYTLVRSGNVSNTPADAWIVVERSPVDKEYDTRAKFGLGKSTVVSTGTNEAGDPEDKSY
jgi:RNA polymerase sigma factor (sigma-70 family)